MELKETFTNREGLIVTSRYQDIESELDFSGKIITGARAYCFHKDKLVIVHESKGHWGMPGGAMETNEDVRAGIRREIKEETNMRVIKMRLFGLIENQKTETEYHIWSACFVEPLGEFSSDPAEEITEIKEIDPHEWLTYPGISESNMRKRIFNRAMQIKSVLDSEAEFSH